MRIRITFKYNLKTPEKYIDICKKFFKLMDYLSKYGFVAERFEELEELEEDSQ